MDPSKQLGKIKEQVELENISRRRYPEKWGKLTGKDVNYFYNQDKINKMLRTADRNINKDICPYVNTGHGDSYFLSKDMFESLVGKCRCGRQRTEGHSINCLQKVQSKYFNDDDDDGSNRSSKSSKSNQTGRAILSSSSSSLSSIASGDNGPGKRTKNKYNVSTEAIDTSDSEVDSLKPLNDIRSQNHHVPRRIPETSNGVIGWPQSRSRFWEWEQSAKYVSPVAKMHGLRVTKNPYNVIFIG